MNINKLAHLVSAIKINFAKNKLIAKAPFSKLNVKILKILYYEGYIRGFKVLDQNIQFMFI